MAPRLTKEAAERALRTGMKDPMRSLPRLLRTLPARVDPAIEAEAARSLALAHHWVFVTSCKRLSPTAIRLFLQAGRPTLPTKKRPPALREELQHYDAAMVLLWDAVPVTLDDASLVAAWRQALDVVGDFASSYPWMSAKRRAKIQRIVDDPRVLAGARAAVARCETVPIDLLAALAIDGDEASLDALIPHLQRAETAEDDTLDMLAKVGGLEQNHPASRLLLARARPLLAARGDGSPARALARAMGLEEKAVFWFVATVETLGAHLRVSVDSRRARFLSFYAWVMGRGRTEFDDVEVSIDELELGSCKAEELPRWLRKIQDRLGAQWRWDGVRLRSSARGSDRVRILTWLQGR